MSVAAGRLLHCCGACAAQPGGLRWEGGRFSAEAVGAGDTLVMPPLANAHDHVRGVRPVSLGAFDLPLELWLLRLTGLPPVDPRLVAAAALGRQARGGLGAIMVHYVRPQMPDRLAHELGIVAAAAREIGVRVAIAVAMRDQNPLGYGPDATILAGLDPATRALVESKLLRAPTPPEAQLALVDEVAAEIEGDGVTVQYGPYGLEWCTPALLRRIAERSGETGRRVHMHLLESPLQREYLDAAFPRGPVHFLDEIGLLSPRLSVAHAAQLRPAEMDLLAERGVIVSINTSSNAMLRNGVAPAAAMHRHGVRLATGHDGFSIDDDDDAFRELRLFSMLHRGTGLGAGIEAGEVLRAACQTGREAVSGIAATPLAPGAPADLLELDRTYAADIVVPFEDGPVLLQRATARAIRRMVVAGRPVLEGGVLQGIDLPGIEAELDAQVRHGAGEYLNWQAAIAGLHDRLGAFYAAGLHRGS